MSRREVEDFIDSLFSCAHRYYSGLESMYIAPKILWEMKRVGRYGTESVSELNANLRFRPARPTLNVFMASCTNSNFILQYAHRASTLPAVNPAPTAANRTR